jgi:hypothetical protein
MEHEGREASDFEAPPPPAGRHAQLRHLLDDWVHAGIDADRRLSNGDADSLVTPVLMRLAEGATVASLAEYLWFEVRDDFGVEPERLRPDLLAERLVAWYQEQTAR